MWLSELTIHHCRILKNTTLQFSPGINFIYGDNGSGKTSLLEALSILSFGRSFRTSRIADVIHYGEEYILASSNTHSEHYGDKRIGIEKSALKTSIRVNKETIHSQAELSKLVPISIIHPLSHQLITGSSSKRRSFIDWIAFYQNPEFHQLWKHYHTIIKQRNAALKDAKLYYAIDHLTLELCKLQNPIHQMRLDALTSLQRTLANSTPDYLLEYKPDLLLNHGLPSELSLDTDSLIDYYQSKLELEKRRGRTIKGVHCADLSISLQSHPASSSASRGQSKILSIILHIAQSLTIAQHGIIAIDDLSAEIDYENHKKLMNYILGLGRQIFITSTDKPILSTLDEGYRLFHVEHGVIKS